jgi:hypothetical protein
MILRRWVTGIAARRLRSEGQPGSNRDRKRANQNIGKGGDGGSAGSALFLSIPTNLWDAVSKLSFEVIQQFDLSPM